MIKKCIKLCTVFIGIFLIGCTVGGKKVEQSTYMLGTYIHLQVFVQDEQKGQRVIEQCFKRIKDIEKKMSVHIEDSQINKVNKKGFENEIIVSSDIEKVLCKAMDYAELTKGAFDPTIGRLVRLWGIGTQKEHIPSKDDIKKALSKTNYQYLYYKKGAFGFSKEGVKIDLGGIAKGYAADEVYKILKKKGIKRGIINLGGNILVLGHKQDDSDWKVGIQNPLEPRGSYIGTVKGSDMSVVTSGNYERYFLKDGQRYHHIIDPKTGYPANNGIISSTIITKRSIDADALSTSIYVMGIGKGMELIEKIEGVECILITPKKEVYVSSGIKNQFEMTDKQFKRMN